MLTTIAVTAVVLVGLYLLVPRIAGLEDTWHRIEDGDPWWLALGVALEAVSFAGYVWLLRAVVRQGGREMSPAAGWRLTLAGVAATAPRAVGQARRRPGRASRGAGRRRPRPAGLALVATLAYQLISVWLPAVPGAFALWRVRHHHLVVADAQ